MKIVLDDICVKEDLYPFTATRSVVDIRVGILTLREKWKFLSADFTVLSEMAADVSKDASTKIPANILPSKKLFNRLSGGEDYKDLGTDLITVEHPWQIFKLNHQAIKDDFKLLTKDRDSNTLPATNHAISIENIFIENGVKIEHCILNASNGPIYIGRNAEIMEGSMIRGPVAICEGSTLKMGTKIYGATTIGPYCVVGGEIKNSVMFGYSNKAHDGYLGDSVIGEWCNLGANTSNSNLKNTAGMVNVWNNATLQYISAGLKCGLIMGDYSRSAINTAFNTGTVAGVCCNIFGNSFPPKYIPDFSWGEEKYKFEKALKDIDSWKKLKGSSITEKEIKILTELHTSQN